MTLPWGRGEPACRTGGSKGKGDLNRLVKRLFSEEKTGNPNFQIQYQAMGEIIYLNGRFVSRKEAKVSLFDHGYLYGDGIFETFRSYDGFIFKLDEHLKRLFGSAHYLMLPIPHGQESLKALIYQTLKKSRLKEAYLRLTVSRGVGEIGIDPRSCQTPTISIIVKEFSGYPKECYSQGIEVVTVSTRRNHSGSSSPQIKSCNFQNNILAKIEINRQNLLEGLMLNHEGYLAEGTISNLFIVKNGRLMTPSVSSGCLEGITRNTVLEIASSQLNLPIQEGWITPYDVYSAEECFLTNSLMELLPVVKVDQRTIGNGKPGAITKRLHEEYKRLVQKCLEEHPGKYHRS